MSTEPASCSSATDTEVAVDGYTWAELDAVVFDSVVPARCINCGAEHDVEPDAEDLACTECGAMASVTSPLRKVGLI